MTLTPTQQKTALAVLLPVAGYMLYSNVFSGGGAPPPVQPPPGTTVRGAPQKLKPIEMTQGSAMAVAGGGPRSTTPPLISRASTAIRRGNNSQEWTPRVGSKRPEDRADPAKTDPTLRLDLLARLGKVPEAAGGRSLFDFSEAPPVKVADDVKITPGKGGAKGGPPVDLAKPPGLPITPSGPPPEAPPPAIPLKFYGFVQGEGGKRAFFRLGEEDIFVAREGQLIQARYKIVRIGLSSALVEDTQVRNNQQSLRIEEIPKENL